MENEFIKGLSGVNIKYIGQHLNHYHICEIWLLGKLFNHRARTIQMYCPHNIKCINMGHSEYCDNCKHYRRFNLTDNGNHITNLVDKE